MRRLHLVYPHGPSIATPDTIGRHLAEGLSGAYDVVCHNWDSLARLRPEQGDVLLGHPHPLPGTVVRRSWRDPRWGRRCIIFPFSGDPLQVATADPLVRSSDVFFAITGRGWFDAMPFTPFAHWASRAVHLDLAVDRADFPRCKGAFAPPGRRRVLYIGGTAPAKNPRYLEEIAALLPEVDFGWIGTGRPLAGITAHGWLDTSAATTRELVAGYDLLLTVGSADANPTTVLEAMSWGLVPVCTPTSGWVGEPGVVNVPLGDARAAVAILRRLLDAPDLDRFRASNDARLDDHFTWSRFSDEVLAGLEAPRRAAAVGLGNDRRMLLRAATAISPYSLARREGRRLARSVVERSARERARDLRAGFRRGAR